MVKPDYIPTSYAEADDNLLTNFDKEETHIYQEAIRRYGKGGLFITEDAYDVYGNKIETCSALRRTQRGDKSEFWRIFDQVKREYDR